MHGQLYCKNVYTNLQQIITRTLKSDYIILMAVDINSKEGKIIRQLIPLSTIPLNQFESICNIITVEEAKSGTFIFKKNDTANDLIYLLKGTITLQSNELKVETIKAGTESSRFALAHQIPRKIDAYSNTPVRFLRLNFDIISVPPGISDEEDNKPMIFDQPEDEIDDADDWMTTLLKSPIFKALPPANLQQILMKLEEVEFQKGQLIFSQGEQGDFYYLIKKGHCLLSRKPSPNAKEIKLAQLHQQDTFGEDSLLSDEPRNVSITALTNTVLLRLSKNNFISLIKEPALKYINYSQIKEELDMGAILLDVRASDAYKKNHLPNSVNAPFFTLHMQLKTFDKKKTIIVVCENENISNAAAFLFLRNKFNALIVKGGMEKIPEGYIENLGPALIESDDEASGITENITEFAHSPESIFEPQPVTDISTDENAKNNSLQIENQQLKQTIQKLLLEKAEQTKKYERLSQQAEKLKTSLDAIKKKGEGA